MTEIRISRPVILFECCISVSEPERFSSSDKSLPIPSIARTHPSPSTRHPNNIPHASPTRCPSSHRCLSQVNVQTNKRPQTLTTYPPASAPHLNPLTTRTICLPIYISPNNPQFFYNKYVWDAVGSGGEVACNHLRVWIQFTRRKFGA